MITPQKSSSKQAGKRAWILLHGLSGAVDKSGSVEASRLMKKVLLAIPKVFPCRHCRASVKVFISRLPANPTSWRRYVYDLHNMVNFKLYRQDVADIGLAEADQKWQGYTPSFNKFKEKKITSKAFIRATIEFLAYMYDDWRTQERDALKEFPETLGKLFKVLKAPYATNWIKTWNHMKGIVNGRHLWKRQFAVKRLEQEILL